MNMYMSVSRFASVVSLLLLSCRCCTVRMLLKFRRSVDWNLFLVDMCSRRHAHIIRTHAHAEAPFVFATASKAYGVIQAQSSSSRKLSEKEKRR